MNARPNGERSLSGSGEPVGGSAEEPRRELASGQWFNSFGVSGATRQESGRTTVFVRSAVGVAIGLLIWLWAGHAVAGGAIILLSVGIGAASLVSDVSRTSIDRFFAGLGEWLGVALSWVLLAPIFFVVFTVVRGWMWLTGSDPLQLAPHDGATYWVESDSHERKTRYASAMFASERLERRKGLSLAALLALAAAALLLSEGLLRIWGFGSPVLYVADLQVGFYPAPGQELKRSGNRISTNAFGMRSPSVAARKPPGTFRVLLIGDSTLYGGSYVDQEQLYSRLLEQHLQHSAGDRPVEVLAIGVNAWGPHHKVGYLEKFGTFDADLVMVNLPIVDIYRPLYGLAAVPFFRVENPPRLAVEEVLGHLAWRFRARIVGAQNAEETAWNSRNGVGGYVRLAELAQASGAEVMFQVLPAEAGGLGKAPPQDEARDVERLRAALAGHAEVTYPIGLFKELGGSAYHDPTHLDVAGHRDYSMYLRDRILEASEAWTRWSSAVQPDPRPVPPK